MSHSDKKGSTGKRSWGRGQRNANAAPRREAYAGNHNPRQGGGAKHYRDNTYASVAIAQVQDQEWKTVWPFEFASSKIQEVTLG